MCAVIGFHAKENSQEQLDFLLKILEQSRIRGLHAFGFTCVKNGELQTWRTNSWSSFVEAVKAAWPFTSFIGHCRYSTSGDYHVELNNQPLVKGGASMVFNGVISMATKDEMEKEFRLKMQTDNDGEVALHRFGKDKAATMVWIKVSPMSFAGLFLTKMELVAIRNKWRPLWSSHAHSATYYSSTKDILKRAGAQNWLSLQPGAPEVHKC